VNERHLAAEPEGAVAFIWFRCPPALNVTTPAGRLVLGVRLFAVVCAEERPGRGRPSVG